MADLRKISLIFVIAVLFAIFVFSLIEAIHPSPDHEDYCKYDMPRVKPLDRDVDCEDPSPVLQDQCYDQGGEPHFDYDAKGCQVYKECSMCRKDYDKARELHGSFVFYVSAVLGVIAVLAGIYASKKRNELNEWIGTGFMIGGLISLFIGTAMHFEDLHRIARPILIAVELAIVIFVAYKKLSNEKKKKR